MNVYNVLLKKPSQYQLMDNQIKIQRRIFVYQNVKMEAYLLEQMKIMENIFQNVLSVYMDILIVIIN